VFLHLLRAHLGLAGRQVEMYGLSWHLARDKLDVRNADVGGGQELTNFRTAVGLLSI